MFAPVSVFDFLNSISQLGQPNHYLEVEIKIGTWFQPIFEKYFDEAVFKGFIEQYPWLPEFSEAEGVSFV